MRPRDGSRPDSLRQPLVERRRWAGVAKAKRKQKLKVYRTPIGFHDAYVAAPSQKAALEAWGSDVNLFARGSAEEVADAELAKEPLENPGVVFKRLRGTGEEQIDALDRDAERQAGKKKKKEAGSRPKSGMTKLDRGKPPKPSRRELEEAEEALAELRKSQREETRALEKRQRALERELGELKRRQERALREAEKKARRARQGYETSMKEWKAS